MKCPQPRLWALFLLYGLFSQLLHQHLSLFGKTFLYYLLEFENFILTFAPLKVPTYVGAIVVRSIRLSVRTQDFHS